MAKFIAYPGMPGYLPTLYISQYKYIWKILKIFLILLQRQQQQPASTGLLVVSQLSTNCQSIVNQLSTEPVASPETLILYT